ncbi:MAG: hypothetical protein QXH99_06670 [Sulfolobales archaeon]
MPVRDNIVDSRFRGMAVKISLVNGDELEGVIDDVSRYELGLLVREDLYIVFRHGINYVEVGAVDLHGERSDELEDSLIGSDFIGFDVEVLLINNRRLVGRLMKISRYELGIRVEDKGFIIPKSSILYIRLRKF